MNKEEFYSQAQSFLEKLFFQFKFPIPPHWMIDHLCFRTETSEGYESYKKTFSAWFELLIESEVNGRPISSFKLPEPVTWRNEKIDLLELPAPKAGKKVVEGFEHIEIVCDVPFSELKGLLSGYRFEEGGLKKAFNQEFEVVLDTCAVKFHHLSLESVINLEKNQKVFSAIKNSRILESLRAYQPLVAGTFPLNLAVEGSDVDLILSASDLAALEAEVRNLCESFEGFRVVRTHVQNQEALIARFSFEQVPFELFAQALPSLQQRAYRHFQVEERLLRQYGSELYLKVLDLRKKGLKTEPAFAEALGLDGDPYLALLERPST